MEVTNRPSENLGTLGDFPGGPVGIRAPNAGGLGSIPSQGTRSRIHAATKKSACCN